MFRQYIKNKRHKYGIKFYELCTYDGLVLNVEIYGGQGFNDEQNLGQTGATVLKLMKPFLNKGYHVFTDNFYNSVALTEYLSKQKTYITGTLRRDRKRNPESVISKKLKEGEMVWCSLNDITVCKWKDKREVLTISNAHQAEMVSVSNRRGKEKMKPNIVKDYNEAMSGIDRSDQMLSYNSALRKTLRWYKKVGVHMFEIFLTNAFYLYKTYVSQKEAMAINEFREIIVNNLVGVLKQPAHLRPVCDFHYLEVLPPTEKKKNPTRRCQYCNKMKIRRESRYVCGYCEDRPPLCIDPCFRLYHSDIQVRAPETVENENDD